MFNSAWEQGFLKSFLNALILPITLYLFAVSFIFLTNAFLLGTYKHAFGHAGYTLLTAVGLAGFLYVFRKDRRDLAATLILYLLLNVPGAMMYWDADSNVRDVFDLPRSLTKNNCWKLFKTPISERWGKQICLNE